MLVASVGYRLLRMDEVGPEEGDEEGLLKKEVTDPPDDELIGDPYLGAADPPGIGLDSDESLKVTAPDELLVATGLPWGERRATRAPAIVGASGQGDRGPGNRDGHRGQRGRCWATGHGAISDGELASVARTGDRPVGD